MPLVTTRMVPRGHLISTDIKQYADLLLGTMTDQPVSLGNTLYVAGHLGTGGALDVQSYATIQADLTVNATGYFGGKLTVDNAFDVTGLSRFYGGVQVRSAMSFVL